MIFWKMFKIMCKTITRHTNGIQKDIQIFKNDWNCIDGFWNDMDCPNNVISRNKIFTRKYDWRGESLFGICNFWHL